MYPSPEPHGHGSTAAPPKPELDPLFCFFLDDCFFFLASSRSSDGDDGCSKNEHNGDLCHDVFRVVNDVQGTASVKGRRIIRLLMMVVMVIINWIMLRMPSRVHNSCL